MFSRNVITTGESENGKTVEGTQRKRRRRGRVGACSDPGDEGRIHQLWLGLFAGLQSSLTAAKFNSLTLSLLALFGLRSSFPFISQRSPQKARTCPLDGYPASTVEMTLGSYSGL